MSNWITRHTVIPAVFLLFRDGNKILLLLRANTGYMDGSYSLPAGHVEAGETAAMAACREAREEVGVEISPEHLRLVHNVHEQAEGHERLNLGFIVEEYTGTIINAEPHKCAELLWCDVDGLPETMVPSVRQILDHVTTGSSYSEFNFI